MERAPAKCPSSSDVLLRVAVRPGKEVDVPDRPGAGAVREGQRGLIGGAGEGDEVGEVGTASMVSPRGEGGFNEVMARDLALRPHGRGRSLERAMRDRF